MTTKMLKVLFAHSVVFVILTSLLDLVQIDVKQSYLSEYCWILFR